MSHNSIESPIPLADIESVLEWVDTFKLSRVTKKIYRDFSDAVLLAEILSVYYPKLVEMHNYPPRNSHSLKLNNWMTLNRKVLKKLKLNLCCDTMEQLANCAPGVIERVLVMVREKIRRDEEANQSLKEESALMSSGGSYYEACGDDEHVLVVPVKSRVNGVLETTQQKVISYESYLVLKEELKDTKDAAEVLKQKVDHLDSMLKMKNERIDELQNQLERKQARRKEVEALQNNLSVPFETVTSPHISECLPGKFPSVPTLKQVDSKTRAEESKTRLEEIKTKLIDSKTRFEESRIPIPKDSARLSKPNLNDINGITDSDTGEVNGTPNVNKIRSDDKMLKDRVSLGQSESSGDLEEFKDSEAGAVITIEETIQKEAKDLITVDIVQE